MGKGVLGNKFDWAGGEKIRNRRIHRRRRGEDMMGNIDVETGRRKVARGFTLVEILIVVVILGILAALVLPQFTRATMDTKKAALSDQLHNIRVQIQLYTLQHGDARPSLAAADWSPLITATTYNSNNCGPYLPSIPRNTINNFSNIAVVATDPAWGDPVVGANIGFVYNPNNGVIWGTNRAGDKVYDESNPANPAND